MSVLTDKKTGRLYIKFNFDSQQYKKRLPEEMTKTQAVKLETKWKNDLFFEANGIRPKKEISFRDFLTEYFFEFAEKNYTKGTFDNAVIICKFALPFFKGKTLRDISAFDIERFKTYRTNLKTIKDTARKPATVIRELGIISKVFSFAVKNDFLEFNPCSKVDRPVCDNIQDKVLPFEKIELFLDSFQSDWARDVSVLILNTGLRRNDALGLKKFNVDFRTKTIILLQGKTGRKVEIPVNEITLAILETRRHNGSELFFPSPRTGRQGVTMKKALAGACRRAKIDKVGTRVLRRTFATILDNMNYSSQIIAKLLGHSDMRSVHRYQRGKDILRTAVDSLPNTNRAKSVPATEKANLKLLKTKAG